MCAGLSQEADRRLHIDILLQTTLIIFRTIVGLQPGDVRLKLEYNFAGQESKASLVYAILIQRVSQAQILM